MSEARRLPALAIAFGCGVFVAFCAPRVPLWGWPTAALCVVLCRSGARIRAIDVKLWAIVFCLGGWRAGAEDVRRRELSIRVAREVGTQLVSGVVDEVLRTGDKPQFIVRSGDRRIRATASQAMSVVPGDRVAFWGRLRIPHGYQVSGAANWRQLAHLKNVQASAYFDVREFRRLGRSSQVRHRVARTAFRARQRMSARLAAGCDPPVCGVTQAMVVGDRESLDSDTREIFQRAGLAHVLAVSGLHLAIVCWLVYAAVLRTFVMWRTFGQALLPGGRRWTGWRPASWAALCAITTGLGYTLITGAQPATVRAMFVVAVVLIGRICLRRVRVIDALALAALGMLCADPHALLTASFQLSFTAVTGLVLVLGRPASGRQPRWWSRLFWGTVVATTASMPFVAMTFGELASGGLVSNFVGLPVTEFVIVPLGLVGSVFGGVVGDGAVVLATGAAELLYWFAKAVGHYAPSFETGQVSTTRAVVMLVHTAVGLAYLRRHFTLDAKRGWRTIALGLGWFVAAAVIYRAPARDYAEKLRVTFVDVGQGDAAVIEFPSGQVWLVDAGGIPIFDKSDAGLQRQAGPGRGAVLPFLRARGIERLDRVLVSHAHPDHYAGLWALLGRIPIRELWSAARVSWHERMERPGAVDYIAFELAARAHGIQISSPPLDGDIEIAGARVRFVFPRHTPRPSQSSPAVTRADPVMSENDSSLVFRLEYAGTSFLFTGDIEAEAEAALAGIDIASDIVKVPHHGSATSSSSRFVAQTGARWAVISCGYHNRFGFPARTVLQRWSDAKTQVLRTDLLGAVSFTITETGARSLRWGR